MSAPSATEPLDTTAAVESPEHVRFHYHLAGPAKRGLAYVIDLLLRGAILLILGVVMMVGGVAAGSELLGASTGLYLVALFAVEWGYYVLFETLWSGRTPGKRALRLRVVTQGGHPLHFADSVLRNLLRAADFLPAAYALGVVVMGRDHRFRRLGDLVAGTMVVVEDRQMDGGPLRIHPPPQHWELSAFPERPPLSGAEIEAIELFLRRCERLAYGRQHELATIVAPLFARRMALPYPGNPCRFLALLYFKARQGRT